MTLLSILLLFTLTWQVLYRAYEQYYYIQRTHSALERRFQDEALLQGLSAYGKAWFTTRGPIDKEMITVRNDVRCYVLYRIEQKRVRMELTIVFLERASITRVEYLAASAVKQTP